MSRYRNTNNVNSANVSTLPPAWDINDRIPRTQELKDHSTLQDEVPMPLPMHCHQLIGWRLLG